MTRRRTTLDMDPESPRSLDGAPDRRPVGARHWRWIVALAGALARAGVSANAISAAGMIACGAAGGLLAMTARLDEPAARLAWLAAALLVQLRGLCNVLDGMVAMERGTASPVGELWNEIPDRVSDAAMLVGLGYASFGSPTLGWAAALCAVFTAYVRAQGRAAGAPQDFRGPMAKPQRMVVVSACAFAVAVLPVEWVVYVVHVTTSGGTKVEIAWTLPIVALIVIILGSLVTAGRRLHGAAKSLRHSSSATEVRP